VSTHPNHITTYDSSGRFLGNGDAILRVTFT
jgi:hypothetical protein